MSSTVRKGKVEAARAGGAAAPARARPPGKAQEAREDSLALEGKGKEKVPAARLKEEARRSAISLVLGHRGDRQAGAARRRISRSSSMPSHFFPRPRNDRFKPGPTTAKRP